MLNAIESGASPSIAHLIAKCWDRRAENRPPTKQIVQELQTQQPFLNEENKTGSFSTYSHRY